MDEAQSSVNRISWAPKLLAGALVLGTVAAVIALASTGVAEANPGRDSLTTARASHAQAAAIAGERVRCVVRYGRGNETLLQLVPTCSL
jgi:NO-binding membrane sensor protein with MHYT domain